MSLAGLAETDISKKNYGSYKTYGQNAVTPTKTITE